MAVVALTGVSVAGCHLLQAPPETPRPRPRYCFNIDQVHGYSTPSNQIFYVQAQHRQIYEVRPVSACRWMDYSEQLEIRPGIGEPSLTRLCEGDAAELHVPGGDRRDERCRIRIERRLSEQEIAALPAEARPQVRRRLFGPPALFGRSND